MSAFGYSFGMVGVIANIKAALQAKGLITTIFYETSQYLIFSSPLTTKNIRIGVINDTNPVLTFYLGDAWTGTFNLANAMAIGQATTSTDYAFQGVDMVVDTNFFLMYFRIASGVSCVCYLGALTNGDPIAFGGNVYSGEVATRARNLRTNQTLQPISLNLAGNILDSQQHFYKFPLYWSENGLLAMDGEVPAETVGVCTCTAFQAPIQFGSTFLIVTLNALYMDTFLACKAPLFCEFGERKV